MENQKTPAYRAFFNKQQETTLQKFIDELIKHNKHTNLVGKSTLIDPWRSHILDSLQIAPFIKNKKSSILDMGTGAGLPGLTLAIVGYSQTTLIDSNSKKINFLKTVCKKLNIKTKIFLNRIENIKKQKYNFIISRALANLNKLLAYAYSFVNNDTVLIFLKGKNANEEIINAKNQWTFNIEIKQSISDARGKILIIKNLKKND